MAKKFEVTILGVNSAYPIHGRHPSCQVVNYNNNLFMIDCGEASQIQLAKYRIKSGKINHIFISHLHGDHCYGLPGLITSYALQGRNAKLTLHGPFGILQFLKGIFEASGVRLPYVLDVKEYDTEISNQIVINPSLSVTTFPMKHRLPTMGFLFNEKINSYNINPNSIKEYDLTVDEIKTAKQGIFIQRAGYEIPFEKITLPKAQERSYAYCSDTIYDRDLIPFISKCDLLYHETTYLDDLESLAAQRMHSTISQAIDIAKRADVEKLIVGHFSSRYKDVSVFLEMGLLQFKGLLLGEEGTTYSV